MKLSVLGKSRRFIAALATLASKRAWGPFTETAEATHFDHAFSVSWAQAGEDIALVAMLGGTPAGRYLDIGAHHPSRFSVTRNLYQRGWSGINVDANRELVAQFQLARPNDVNVCAAVGHADYYDLAVFSEPAISTVSREWEARFYGEGQRLIRHERIPGMRLVEILDRWFPDEGPDLLNIDIEGADEDALRSAELERLPKSRWPRWILLESSPPVPRALETGAVAYAVDLGYVPTLVLPMATLLEIGD